MLAKVVISKKCFQISPYQIHYLKGIGTYKTNDAFLKKSLSVGKNALKVKCLKYRNFI